MNRNLFSHPRKNPRWLINLARAIGAARRFVGHYIFYRSTMNHNPAQALRKARETHV